MNTKFRSSSILFLLILLIYTPFVINAGFGPGDDFGHVQSIERYNNFSELLNFNFNISPSRPVAGFIITLTNYLFENQIIFYNFLSVSIWILTGLIISKVIKKLFNKETSNLFLIIFIFPYLCVPMFIGNHLWASYIGFIFFWSLSLYFQVKFSFKTKFQFFILFNLFFILSIFTLELVLPLILINFLLTFFLKQKKIQKILSILSIFFISLFFFIYKVYALVEIFNIKTYGLGNFSSLKNLFQGIYFYYVLSVENLILIFKSIKYINIKSIIILFILSIFIFTKKNEKKNSGSIKFLIPFLGSLLIMPIVFIISGYPANSFGTMSRMLIPSFLCFSVIVSFYLIKLNINKYLLIFILFLFINTFTIQIDNQIKASKQRDRLYGELINKVINSEIKTGDKLIVYVPIFLEKNFNNEEIVFTSWDFEGRLIHFTKKNLKIKLLSDRMILDKNYYPSHNFYTSNFNENDFNFFYNYKTNELKLLNQFELNQHLSNINKNINIQKIKNNIILNEKIRLFFKSKINYWNG